MDDSEHEVPGAVALEVALYNDPVYRLFGAALSCPWRLGLVLALLVLVTIVFGASAASRFIYTDF